MSPNRDDKQSSDDAESNEKWGFKSGRKGMATETKIGLLLILVLLGAFGFVVYKKMDRHPSEGLDTVKPHHHEKDKGPFELDDPEAPKPGKGLDDFAKHGSKGHNGKSHDDVVQNAIQKHNEAHGKGMKQTEPDPFAATNAAKVFTADPNPKPFKETPAPQKTAQSADPFPPADFDSRPKGVRAQNVSTADSFGAPAVANWGQGDQTKPGGTTIRPETKVTNKPAPLPDDGFNPLNESPPGKTFVGGSKNDLDDLSAFDANINRSNQRVQELPDPSEPGRGGRKKLDRIDDGLTGDPTWDGGQVIGQRDKNKPVKKDAPALEKNNKRGRIDDFPVSDNNFDADNTWDDGNKGGKGKHHHGGKEAPPPELVGEPAEVYIVESGDNYWHISKKKYGTARYFTALARFNEQRIPDPKAMRPGMKVLCPTTEQLEHCYPHLCPRESGVTQVGGTSEDGCRPGMRPGFYVDASGQPMYRVGKADTLTEIAKRHLGRSSRWIQVFELNRGLLPSPNSLKIGMELQLPADASQVELAQEPVDFR